MTCNFAFFVSFEEALSPKIFMYHSAATLSLVDMFKYPSAFTVAHDYIWNVNMHLL